MLTNLKPNLVWQIFNQITQVPRPSKKEEKIIAFLEKFATTHSLTHRKDAIGNVVIYKTATPGMENHPTVILQSHVDMVCEKNSDTVFDFDNDAIQAYVDGEWVRAKGTTLGADCGIGMAAALAVLVSDDVAHGPVEALFTVDEETGLTGAFNLAPDLLSGKYLINLDSEDEGEIFIGCAGGIDTLATFDFHKETLPAEYTTWKISVKGLSGGHSGDDINKGLGNSNKILNRFLWEAERKFGLRLGWFEGGNLRNAIPREAYALFAVPADQAKALSAAFENFSHEVRSEFQYTEKNLTLILEQTPTLPFVVDPDTQHKLLNTIYAVACGVLEMSRSIEGMVETSTNLASVKFGKNQIEAVTSQRSSVESAKRNAANMVEAAFLLGGARVVHSDGYPGWAPNPKSHLLKVVTAVYEKEFGKVPAVKTIHAGLECGLFLQKYPHLEMVSFGPTLRGVHSPDERLQISTVEPFWLLLVNTLRNI